LIVRLLAAPLLAFGLAAFLTYYAAVCHGPRLQVAVICGL